VRYLFVEREKVNHAIVMLCRVLRVSCSGSYAWRKRKPSARAREDAVLTARIKTIHEQSRRTYGAPRVHAELAAGGARCGRKRVARLMRAAGVVGCHRRRHVVTTVREPSTPPAPDRMERQFVAGEPNTRWTADITSVPTWSGFLYVAVVPGALWALFSRRIVGWAMADHLRTELVLSALEMALWNRRPDPGVIHHFDHGCQYTSITFGNRCQETEVVPSLGSRGDCYDNAIAESFFASLECELLDRHKFRTHTQARTAIFDYLEGFNNTHRRHSALGYLSPAALERQFKQEIAA
jgi:putative transposase